MTHTFLWRVLARVAPATAIALAAAAVSMAALRALDGPQDGSDIVRASVLLTNAGLWWAFTVVTVFRAAPARRGPRLSGIILLAVASAAALAVDPTGAGAARWPQLAASGAVSLISLALAFGALGRLGRCFGVLPDARGMVTGGPYRVVRHPLYLGELGAVAGILVATPNARNVVALGTLAAAQMGRARLEERTLTSAFPGYAAYAAVTPMLFPHPEPVLACWRRLGPIRQSGDAGVGGQG